MFTLKKIWDALNHAGKPWQISLALAFGMVVGFTPIVSLHNIIIFLVVLLLNIHIGIFILAVSVFAILGLILDPLFSSLGTTILTSDGLNSFFTLVYNDPVGYLSGFNNTILMGSLVVSLVLFPLVYIVFSIIMVKYRSAIATKIKNIPLLNKLQFFQNEDVKKVKTFRIMGVLLFVFILGTVSLFKILIFDGLVKANIEIAVNKSTDKIVKIGNLSTSIFNSSIVLENLSITDKKDISKNINIKDITVNIELSQLIFKKVIVENLIIKQISFPSTANIATTENKNKKSTNETQKNNSSTNMLDVSSLKNINTLDIKEGFSKDYKAEFDKYKEYYNQIKPLFTSEKKLEQKRADGDFIYFDLVSNIPNFLIKKGTFSLIHNDDTINGTFKDFTTNQFLHKKPFELSINTTTKQFKSLSVNLSILETKKRSLDTLNIKIKEFSIKPINQKNISITNTKIDTTMDLKITDKKALTGYESIDVITSDIAFNETNNYIALLNESLIETKGIKGNIVISGDINNPKLKIDSNIDKILKDKINAVLSSQKENIKKEIKKKVKSKIEDKVKSKLKGILGF